MAQKVKKFDERDLKTFSPFKTPSHERRKKSISGFILQAINHSIVYFKCSFSCQTVVTTGTRLCWKMTTWKSGGIEHQCNKRSKLMADNLLFHRVWCSVACENARQIQHAWLVTDLTSHCSADLTWSLWTQCPSPRQAGIRRYDSITIPLLKCTVH